MYYKINAWWLALVAFATFVGSGVFLISVLITYSAETYSFREGGITSAYNWSTQRIRGSEGFCYGLWSCANVICQLGSLPDDKFVAITPIAPFAYNTTDCTINSILSISWLLQWYAAKASVICLAIAICIEVLAIAMFLVTQYESSTLLRKVIYYILMTLGPLLMTTAHVCAYVTMLLVIRGFVDSPPTFVVVWQMVTSAILLLIMFFSHSLLRTPAGVRYEEF